MLATSAQLVVKSLLVKTQRRSAHSVQFQLVMARKQMQTSVRLSVQALSLQVKRLCLSARALVQAVMAISQQMLVT
jgi:hypothetical protein